MNIVKELRKSAGMQQKELAIAVGVAAPTVSEWEHQKKDPSGERLIKLSELFEVEPAVILGAAMDLSVPRPVTDDDIKFALFGGADGVTDEDYEDVKRYAAYVKARKNGGSL